MAAFGSQVQRRLASRGFCIDLGSRAQQQSCHPKVPVASGHVQRSSAQVVFGVHIRTAIKKKLGDVAIIIADAAMFWRRCAPAHRAMQRRLPVLVNGFGVATELQEQSGNFDLVLPGRPMQRRAAEVIAHIKLADQRQQIAYHFRLSITGRAVQTALTAVALGPDIRAAGQQQFGHVQAAVLGSTQEA